MRSFILPAALLAASVLAAPNYTPDCETKGNTVVEYYDVTVTEVVYYTPGSDSYQTAAPAHTTTRRKHKHKPSPKPSGYVVTITEEPYQPAPTYAPPQAQAPKPKPQPQPPTSYSQKPTESGDYKQDIINFHNYWRSHHGAGPLEWDDDLANYAAGNTGSCQMQHTGGPYGENLAYGTSLTGYEGSHMWYAEGSQYNGQGFSEETGHYTQLIWKGSTKIGCYLQNCGDSNYLMCEYSPPGNVEGGYEDNCGSTDTSDPNEYN